MKRDAIDALRAIRDDLQGGAGMRRHLLDLSSCSSSSRSSRSTSWSPQPGVRERRVARVRARRRRPAHARRRRGRRRRGAAPAPLRVRPRARRDGGAASKPLPEVERARARGDARRRRRPTTCTTGCCRSCARSPQARLERSGPRREPRDARPLVGAPPPRPPSRPRTASRPASPSASCARSSPTLRGCDSRWTSPRSARLSNRVLDEVEKAVVGKRDALELLLLGLLADGHVLIEDYPGLAKTLMARSFAQVTSLDFSRIQFTPDLMPSDVTGLVDLQPARGRLRVPARARSSPTCCSRTRSTAPRRRRRPRCSRRCRSGR